MAFELKISPRTGKITATFRYNHKFSQCLCCRPTATAAARSTATTRAAAESTARRSTVIALVNQWGYSLPCVIPNNDTGPQTCSSDKSYTLKSLFISFGLCLLLCSVDYRKISSSPPQFVIPLSPRYTVLTFDCH
jgi:hypothetical protein